jgi:hypothetical protein
MAPVETTNPSVFRWICLFLFFPLPISACDRHQLGLNLCKCGHIIKYFSLQFLHRRSEAELGTEEKTAGLDFH